MPSRQIYWSNPIGYVGCTSSDGALRDHDINAPRLPADTSPGHDKSGAGSFAAPNAKEARDDVETLKKTLDTIRDRRKAPKLTAPP